MLTKTQHEEIRARLTELETWVDSIRTRRNCRKCYGSGIAGKTLGIKCEKCNGQGYTLGWASYKPEDKPQNIPDVTNAERSALEVYEFMTAPPERYFLYIDEKLALATTWTGEKLGLVSFGKEFRSSFGDKRVPVTVAAINGKTYHGIYYKSAGSYARVKQAKEL